MSIQQPINNLFEYLIRNQKQLLYLFLFIFGAAILIARIGVIFSYQGLLAGIDNNFAYPVMRMLKKLSIYPDPENYPFAVNPYAPLLFYTSYLVCSILGIEAGDTIQIYFATRALCLVYDLFTCYILFRLMRKYLHIQAPVAILSVLCFLYLVSYWGYTMGRSDSMCLLCFSIIVYLMLSYLSFPTYVKLFWIAVMCNIAIFSKQNAVITPVLISVALFYYRMWKPLFSFLFCFAIIFAGCLILFSNIYPNGAFIAHLAKALNNRIDFRWYYIEIFKRLVGSFAIFPLAAGFFFALQQIAAGKNKMLVSLSIIAIISTCWGAALALKWGSHPGYFHEAIFCFTAILAYTMTSAEFSLAVRKFALPVFFVLSIIFSHILLQLFFFFLNNRAKDKQIYLSQKEVAVSLLKEIGTRDNYIFAYTEHYIDFFKSLLQEKAVVPNLDAVSCCTYPDGNFNYSRLKEGFQNGKIEFIIFKANAIDSSFYDISFSKYRFYKTINGYSVFRFQK